MDRAFIELTNQKLGQSELVYWVCRSRTASWWSQPVGCLFYFIVHTAQTLTNRRTERAEEILSIDTETAAAANQFNAPSWETLNDGDADDGGPWSNSANFRPFRGSLLLRSMETLVRCCRRGYKTRIINAKINEVTVWLCHYNLADT